MLFTKPNTLNLICPSEGDLPGEKSKLRGSSLWLIFTFFLLIYLLTTDGRITSSDGTQMYWVTQALVERHTLALDASDPEVRAVAHQGRDGHYYSIVGLGLPLFDVPFYMFGQATAWFQPQIPQRFFTKFWVSLNNAFITALSCLTLFLLSVQLGLNQRISLLNTVILGFATLAWPYAKDDFADPLLGLCALLSIYSACRFRSTHQARWVWASGAGLVCGFLTKHTGVLFIPAVVGLILHTAFKADKSRRRIAIRQSLIPLMVTLVLGVIIWGTYNYVRYGGWTNTGYYESTKSAVTELATIRSTHKGWPGLVAYLVSPKRGLLVYMPILLVGLAGWRPLWQRRRAETLCLLATLIPFWVIHGLLVGAGFSIYNLGPRYLIPMVPLLVLFVGSAIFEKKSLRQRWGSIMVAGLFLISLSIQLSFVLVDYRRYTVEIGAAREQGKVIPYSVAERGVIPGQFRNVWFIFTLDRRSKSQMSYDLSERPSEKSLSFQLQHALSWNVPNFWFVHLWHVGFPRPLILLSLAILIAGIGATGYGLWRKVWWTV